MTPQLWTRNLEWNEWRQMHPDLNDQEAEYLYMAELKMFRNYQNELINQAKIRQARLSGDLMNMSADISTVLTQGGNYKTVVITPAYTLLEGSYGNSSGILIGSGPHEFNVGEYFAFDWTNGSNIGTSYAGIYEVIDAPSQDYTKGSPGLDMNIQMNVFVADVQSGRFRKVANLDGYPWIGQYNDVTTVYGPGVHNITLPDVPEGYEPYTAVRLDVIGGGGAGRIGARVGSNKYYVGGGGGGGGRLQHRFSIAGATLPDLFRITVGEGAETIIEGQGENSMVQYGSSVAICYGGSSGEDRNFGLYPEIGGEIDIPLNILGGGNGGSVVATFPADFEFTGVPGTDGAVEIIDGAYDQWPRNSDDETVRNAGKGGPPNGPFTPDALGRNQQIQTHAATFEFDSSGNIVGTGTPGESLLATLYPGTGGGGGVIDDSGTFNGLPGRGTDGVAVVTFGYI